MLSEDPAPIRHARAKSVFALSTPDVLLSRNSQLSGPPAVPFPIACRDAIRFSLPQAKVLDRRRQGLGLVALAVARDLCGIPLKAVVVQDFAIGS